MPPDNGKRNEWTTLPCSDEKVKRKNVWKKDNPGYRCGGFGGNGGISGGGGNCPKYSGCYPVASIFATGTVGTWVGAYFNVSKTIYGENGFESLFDGWNMNGGLTTGVYGLSISVGIELGAECAFPLSATGSNCE
jgi:hypothetical protein